MRVLVVDDEDMISQLVEVVLAGSEVLVSAAASIAEARRMLTSDGPFDAVLLDLSLPDGDGEDLLTEIFSAAGPRPRVVLFSAVDPHRIRRATRRYGISGLPKPFEPPALRRALGLQTVAA